MKILCCVLFMVAVTTAKHEQYKGWKSFFLKPTTQEQLNFIGTIAVAYEVDIISHPILEREGVVLVKPEHLDGFVLALEEHNLSYRIHSRDIKDALDHDDKLIEVRNNKTRARSGKQLPYDNYHELEVIYEYMEDIATRYPNLVTLIQPAESFLGVPIKYLKISTTNFEDESKPVIFIDGGIHAREWISPPTVTWAIKKLVEDVTEPDLLERFDWILLPVVNPDGYKHTFARERFWRKTRSTDQHIAAFICRGVDGNRNFGYAFNTVGTSNHPCSDIYPGSRAFSEVETRVVRDIIHENLHRMALYLTIHSYGSMILYPWGDGTLSNNAFALHTVGIAMADAIQRNKIDYFPNYVVGNSMLVVGYATSGSSEDYAHSVGVPLTYTYELPGLDEEDDDDNVVDYDSDESSGDDGNKGFHLDPKYIEQVCRETWEGIVVGARRAGDLFTRVQ